MLPRCQPATDLVSASEHDPWSRLVKLPQLSFHMETSHVLQTNIAEFIGRRPSVPGHCQVHLRHLLYSNVRLRRLALSLVRAMATCCRLY